MAMTKEEAKIKRLEKQVKNLKEVVKELIRAEFEKINCTEFELFGIMVLRGIQ